MIIKDHDFSINGKMIMIIIRLDAYIFITLLYLLLAFENKSKPPKESLLFFFK